MKTLFLIFLILDVEFLCLLVKFLTSVNISSTLQIKYNRALKKKKKTAQSSLKVYLGRW